MASFGPDDLLQCYRRGVFPMAESRDDEGLFIVDPEERTILPLDAFHIPSRLARTVRAEKFEITIDHDFNGMIAMCAERTSDRPETWINDDIRALYSALHMRGYAHSIEAHEGGTLAGGLYGVAVGGAFFGESMASRVRDASKVALVHLVARLRVAGFALLDAQFMTEHLRMFGAVTMTRRAFHQLLVHALPLHPDLNAFKQPMSGRQALQSIAHIS